MIKVLTGMRRSGKSTLLDLWERKLIDDGIAPEHIIHINFEFMLWDDVKDYRALYQLLQEQMAGKEHVYLLLDEIQLVQHWEKAVNSIFAEQRADIYVTGSNAKMLSSEIATLLSGRYVLIEVYPLSFREYLDFCPDEKKISMSFPKIFTVWRDACYSRHAAGYECHSNGFKRHL